MNKSFLVSLFILFLLICLNSCTTYYIPLQSFKEQFRGMDSSKLIEVTTQGPAGDKVKYKTYPIRFIKCVDKNGNPFELKNSPAIEIRFTDSSNKRTIYYFDLISVDSTHVRGSQSRFIHSIHKTIRLDKVKLIEVQDGGKKFRYVD